MANGNEIWLGYNYPEYHMRSPKDAPRLPWPLATDGSDDGDEIAFRERLDTYFHRKDVSLPLRKAHESCCLEMGWLPAKKPRGITSRLPRTYWRVGGKAGEVLEFDPFNFDVQIGGEQGFEVPDIPIGVPLSGRYAPVFLDYKNDGGLSNPLNLEDPELLKMILLAREHIFAHVPWLADAKWLLVECHY